MNRTVALALTAALSLGVLAGCGGGSGKTTQLTVTLGEGGKWTFNPDTITANKGDKIEVTLVNKDTAQPHSLVIPDLNFKSGEVAIGKEAKFTINASKSGTFDFWCDVPGHKEGNMIGKITVN